MPIGYITLQGRGLIDDCIAEGVALLQARGIRLAGTVRAAPVRDDGHSCDMDIRILPDGPVYRISQSLGAGSRGCRLDPACIETLAQDVERRLCIGDLVVINKFGKQECQSKGLSPVIAQAILMNLPVVVGVNGLNLSGFLAFAGEFAEPIEAAPAAIVAWATSRLTSTSPAAAR